MLIPNHPHDERLSELASRETDALADAGLTAHVDSCVRCTELITELSVLRAALADLPEVAPSRPLRLLPPVEAEPPHAVDRLGGWARRFFAPVLASGAALALVGTIGTAAPAFSEQAGTGGAAPGAGEERASTLQVPATESAPSEPDGAAAAASEAAAAGVEPEAFVPADGSETEDAATFGDRTVAADDADPSHDLSPLELGGADAASSDALATERSPWPMVLFAGVALMIGALLLRWILVPRAG